MTSYEERLLVPWWAWPTGIGLALLLAAPVHGGRGGLYAWLPYVVAAAVAVLALLAASRGRVRVQDGVLHVPGARVPLTHVGAVRALDRETTRRLTGPTADLRAHVVHKPWLRRAVQVRIEDPDDDTPYWLVGSRRPEALATAVHDGVTAAGRGPSS